MVRYALENMHLVAFDERSFTSVWWHRESGRFVVMNKAKIVDDMYVIGTFLVDFAEAEDAACIEAFNEATQR